MSKHIENKYEQGLEVQARQIQCGGCTYGLEGIACRCRSDQYNYVEDVREDSRTPRPGAGSSEPKTDDREQKKFAKRFRN